MFNLLEKVGLKISKMTVILIGYINWLYSLVSNTGVLVQWIKTGHLAYLFILKIILGQ